MCDRLGGLLVSSLLGICLIAASSQSAEGGGDGSGDAWVLSDAMGPLYAEQCAVCHGDDLEGAAQGPGLRGELIRGGSLSALVTSISKGFPNGGMPGWAGILPNDDIRGLAIYLLEKREGRPADDYGGDGALPTMPGLISSARHGFTLRQVRGGITEPYSIAPLPDGRILLTEKMGGLSIVSADGETTTPVAGTPRIYDDGHLRGNTWTGNGWAHEVALHPDYASNGWVYLVYGDRCQDCTAASRESGKPATMLKLVRGRLQGSKWVDQEVVWNAPRETYRVGMENGLGARLAFDDAGCVYLSIGSIDEDYRRVQDLGYPDGKIIRMHDDGRTPGDNPFRGAEGALASIFSLGHRNPQGLDWDPKTRLLWSSEHGPRGGDEVNIIHSGRNYGWPLVSLGVGYDGRPIHYAKDFGLEFDAADLTPASIDFTPSPGVSSIVFYRGNAFPKWQNHLIVATLRGTALLRFEVDENGATHRETLIPSLGRFRDVEVGPGGELLLLLEHNKGSMILRMEPAESQANALDAHAPGVGS